MRILKSLVILLLVATPAVAQNPTDFNVWISWADISGENEPEPGIKIDFESASGFGVSANWFLTPHLSTELGVLALKSDGTIDVEEFAEEIDLGSLDLIPVTLIAQFHFARDSRIDPYVGVGAAYVMADDLDSDDLDLLQVGSVEVDDEFTYVINAGLGLQVTSGFGIVIDGKYIALEPATRGEGSTEDELDLELNPLIVSVGLRWRF